MKTDACGDFSASPFTIDASGKIEKQAGSVIEARNTASGGNGDNIAITAGGSLTMAATSGANPGARIDTGAGGASQNSAANITLDFGGNMDMGSGSAVKAESAQNGNGGAISITVNGNRSLENNGEINADGGPGGRGWIDLFAGGDIIFTGASEEPFAVHANRAGGADQVGGDVTVKSTGGKVIASGLAFQADGHVSGGTEGKITIEAVSDVTLDTASIFARGDDWSMGGYGEGGQVGVRSFTGTLSWQDGVGGVQPTGTGIGNAGTITLQDCTAGPINRAGTSFPVTAGSATTPTELADSCGGAPALPLYVLLPKCACEGGGQIFCEKAPVQVVLDAQLGRFPGNKGPDVSVDVRTHSIQAAVDAAADTNNDNYIIIGVVAKDNGAIGGSTSENVVISKAYPKRLALIGCSVTINALDANLAAGHITTGASSPVGSPENIFVMDLHGADSSLAGWLVKGNGRYMPNVENHDSGTEIKFIGNNNTMHNGNGNDNGTGMYIQGNGNFVDSSDVFGNSGAGIVVLGDSNTINKVDGGDKGNGGDGINVTGSSNTIQENGVFASGINGIVISGNSNTLLKNNLGDRGKGNALNGIVLSGNTNTIQENDAYSNGGTAISATGTGNTLYNNTSGDRGDKANGGAAFYVSGGSSLVQNTAIGNLGAGFKFATAGFSLKNNVSGGTGSGYPNGGCQYNFTVAGNINQGRNKSNGVTLAGTPFTAGCR